MGFKLLSFYKQFKQKNNFKNYFNALNKLQLALFASYLAENLNNASIYQARANVLCELKKLRQSHRYVDIASCERLFETILLLGQLRFRVSDRAFFSVCVEELLAVSKSLSAVFMFSYSQNKLTKCLKMFDQAVENFESLYNNILKVTARDPLIFQFFFVALFAFRKEVKLCVEVNSIAY